MKYVCFLLALGLLGGCSTLTTPDGHTIQDIPGINAGRVIGQTDPSRSVDKTQIAASMARSSPSLAAVLAVHDEPDAAKRSETYQVIKDLAGAQNSQARVLVQNHESTVRRVTISDIDDAQVIQDLNVTGNSKEEFVLSPGQYRIKKYDAAGNLIKTSEVKVSLRQDRLNGQWDLIMHIGREK